MIKKLWACIPPAPTGRWIKSGLLLASTILLLELPSFGQQPCIPDPQYTNTSTQNGIYPDTTTNFGPAYVGTPYSQLITIVIPPDTTVSPITCTWDSTVITNVSGLPPSLSLSYACWNQNGFGNPNHCAWKGNSIGCAIITGTPVTADIGTHTLQMFTITYLSGFLCPANTPVTITGYKIVVSGAIAVNENPNIQILQQNNPNPFSNLSEIQFTAEDNGTAQFKIYNLIGTVIQQYDMKVKKGINTLELDAKNFDSGIYFYSVVHGSTSFTRKMIVNK